MNSFYKTLIALMFLYLLVSGILISTINYDIENIKQEIAQIKNESCDNDDDKELKDILEFMKDMIIKLDDQDSKKNPRTL